MQYIVLLMRNGRATSSHVCDELDDAIQIIDDHLKFGEQQKDERAATIKRLKEPSC